MGSIFRKEEYVYINDILISNNGFKNMTFETSKFSDSISPIRGFGSYLNENNLSTIDTINLEFYVDVNELQNIAYVYSMFKIFGALPLKNKYIKDKIANSLEEEQSIIDFKKTNKTKNVKEIEYIIVMLQDIKITSIEKTDNGFSVYMRLVMLNKSFTEDEMQIFRTKFKEWSSQVDFYNKCNFPISSYIDQMHNIGPLIVKFYNIEKLNAKYRNKFILNSASLKSSKVQKASQTDINDNDVNKLSERDQNIAKMGKIFDPSLLVISGKNIVQLEFITNNMIAEIPIIGKNIVNRSSLGIGKGYYNVKLIYDELDNQELKNIKDVSNKNITNHKIEIEHPLLNMFDFYSGTIKNIIFNNVEQFNGIMVTIQFQVAGYKYGDESDNIGNLANSIIEKEVYDLKHVGSYMELCIDSINKLSETTRLNDNKYKHSDIFYESIHKIMNTIIQQSSTTNYATSHKFLDTLTSVRYTAKFLHYISMYASEITSPYKINSFMNDADKEIKLQRNGIDIIQITDTSYNDIIGNDLMIEKKRALTYASELNNNLSLFESITNVIPEANGLKDGFDNDIYNLSYSTQKDEELYNKITTLIKKILMMPDYSQTINRRLISSSRELPFKQIAGFYNYCDLIGLLSVGLSKNAKKMLYTISNTRNYIYTLIQSLFDNLFEYCYSSKFSSESGLNAKIDMIYTRELYLRAFGSLNFGIFSNTTKEIIDDQELIMIDSSVNYKKIYEYISTYIEMFYNSLMNLMNNNTFKERMAKEIQEMSTIGQQERLSSKEIIMQLIDAHTDELKKEIQDIYQSSQVTIKELSYNIFLSKYLFILGSLHYNGKDSLLDAIYADEIEHTLLIKTMIISSSLLGFFSLKTESRTDDYGNVFKATSNQISNILKIYFGVSQEVDENKSEPVTFYDKFYYNLKSNSYYDQFIKDSKKIPRKEQQKTVESLKKDCNYIYKNKILNLFPELFIDESMINTGWLESKNACEDFIREYRDKFLNQTTKFTKWINIKKNEIIGYLPTLSKIMKNNGQISDVMKKRIIGHKDIFMDFERISKLVNDNTTTTMPNYDVIIKTRIYSNKFAGVSRMVSMKSVVNIGNMVNVSIAKNGSTKIKTASVTFIDVNHESINYTNSESIGLINSENDELTLLKLDVGSEIEIYLGYSDSKKMIYKGFIKKINYMNKVISMDCVDAASALYNYSLSELTLRTDKDASGKSILINDAVIFFRHLVGMDSAVKSNGTIYANIASQIMNGHLFSYTINDDGNTTNEAIDYTYFFVDEQRVTSYNGFATSLALCPSTTLSLFDPNRYVDSKDLLIMHMKPVEKIFSTFGTMREENDISKDYAISAKIFSGLNNVDCDYETYGINNTIEEINDIEKNDMSDLEEIINIEEPDTDKIKQIMMQDIKIELAKEISDEHTESLNKVLGKQYNNDIPIYEKPLFVIGAEKLSEDDMKINFDKKFNELDKNDLIKEFIKINIDNPNINKNTFKNFLEDEFEEEHAPETRKQAAKFIHSEIDKQYSLVKDILGEIRGKAIDATKERYTEALNELYDSYIATANGMNNILHGKLNPKLTGYKELDAINSEIDPIDQATDYLFTTIKKLQIPKTEGYMNKLNELTNRIDMAKLNDQYAGMHNNLYYKNLKGNNNYQNKGTISNINFDLEHVKDDINSVKDSMNIFVGSLNKTSSDIKKQYNNYATESNDIEKSKSEILNNLYDSNKQYTEKYKNNLINNGAINYENKNNDYEKIKQGIPTYANNLRDKANDIYNKSNNALIETRKILTDQKNKVIANISNFKNDIAKKAYETKDSITQDLETRTKKLYDGIQNMYHKANDSINSAYDRSASYIENLYDDRVNSAVLNYNLGKNYIDDAYKNALNKIDKKKEDTKNSLADFSDRVFNGEYNAKDFNIVSEMNDDEILRTIKTRNDALNDDEYYKNYDVDKLLHKYDKALESFNNTLEKFKTSNSVIDGTKNVPDNVKIENNPLLDKNKNSFEIDNKPQINTSLITTKTAEMLNKVSSWSIDNLDSMVVTHPPLQLRSFNRNNQINEKKYKEQQYKKLSLNGFKFIKQFDNLDSYYFNKYKFKSKDEATENALKEFNLKNAKILDYINENLVAEIDQNQFDTLVMIGYNSGIPAMYDLISKMNAEASQREISKFFDNLKLKGKTLLDNINKPKEQDITAKKSTSFKKEETPKEIKNNDNTIVLTKEKKEIVADLPKSTTTQVQETKKNQLPKINSNTSTDNKTSDKKENSIAQSTTINTAPLQKQNDNSSKNNNKKDEVVEKVKEFFNQNAGDKENTKTQDDTKVQSTAKEEAKKIEIPELKNKTTKYLQHENEFASVPEDFMKLRKDLEKQKRLSPIDKNGFAKNLYGKKIQKPIGTAHGIKIYAPTNFADSNIISGIFKEFRARDEQEKNKRYINYRYINNYDVLGVHQGVDIYGPSTAIYAPFDCKVTNATFIGGYGNVVEGYYIDRTNSKYLNTKFKLSDLGSQSKYHVSFLCAHLAHKTKYKVGDIIPGGTQIGVMGRTTTSGGKVVQAGFGIHLHFEIKLGSVRIDPLQFYGLRKFTYNWDRIGESARKKGSPEQQRYVINYQGLVDFAFGTTSSPRFADLCRKAGNTNFEDVDTPIQMIKDYTLKTKKDKKGNILKDENGNPLKEIVLKSKEKLEEEENILAEEGTKLYNEKKNKKTKTGKAVDNSNNTTTKTTNTANNTKTQTDTAPANTTNNSKDKNTATTNTTSPVVATEAPKPVVSSSGVAMKDNSKDEHFSNIDFLKVKFNSDPVKDANCAVIASYAFPVAMEMGIDPFVLLAQWTFESAWGAKESGNNAFGIRPSKNTNDYWDGKSVTKVDSAGNKTKFKEYDTYENGLRDYAYTIKNYYAETIKKDKNLDSLAKYAAEKEYPEKIAKQAKAFAKKFKDAGIELPEGLTKYEYKYTEVKKENNTTTTTNTATTSTQTKTDSTKTTGTAVQKVSATTVTKKSNNTNSNATTTKKANNAKATTTTKTKKTNSNTTTPKTTTNTTKKKKTSSTTTSTPKTNTPKTNKAKKATPAKSNSTPKKNKK